MAAAIIPIVASAIATALPIIRDLIQQAEQLFGSQTGSIKKAAVVDGTKALIAPAAAAGRVDGLPTDTELGAVVEAVLAQMKAAGQLVLSGTAPLPAPAGQNSLVGLLLDAAKGLLK